MVKKCMQWHNVEREYKKKKRARKNTHTKEQAIQKGAYYVRVILQVMKYVGLICG